MAFAQDTSVPVERSRSEIETLVRRYGASRFGSAWDSSQAAVTFVSADRMVKFVIRLPAADDERIVAAARGRLKYAVPSKEAVRRAQDAEERRLWRCLVLVIKAKLEAVESGVESFDEAFLAHIVSPAGRTVMEEIRALDKKGGQRFLGAVGGAD